MAAGTVVAWHVAPGDHVEKGTIVAEIETEKGVFDFDIPFAGTIEAVLVPKGTKVPVGTPIARIAVAAAAARAEPSPAAAIPSAAPTPTPSAIPAPAPPSEAPRRRASPAARRLAEQRGLDLSAIEGTGPDHVIELHDVQRALEPRATSATAPAALAPAVSTMRQAIAAAVSRSKREIPHYYLSTDIDVASMLAWLAVENVRRPVTARILPAAVLLKAVAVALAKHRDLNGWWVEGAFQPADGVHVGVAISLRGGGLVAPAIHDADTLKIDDLMAALRDLVERARTGGLRSSEMTGASATVTNLGDEGASTVFGVIHPPQVCIVGFGGITERPWAAGGMLGVRPVVTATLSGDHRATDGHYGSRFLAELDGLLQHPELL